MLYSKRDITRAGRLLVSPGCPEEERAQAIDKVNYWRELHQEPMQLLLADLDAQTEGAPSTLIAGRIKKLDTIVDKLGRAGTPSKLHTMYDIAGCRAVVPDMGSLLELKERMLSLPGCDMDRTRKRDYLLRPKESGYRSCHAIFKYECNRAGTQLNAELQLRTRLQHEWATAVEMYDLATRSRLKFNDAGCVAWRFFQVASRLIEHIETGQGDRATRAALAHELAELDGCRSIVQDLHACSQSVSLLADVPQLDESSYCLVDIDIGEQVVKVDVLGADDAVAAYCRRESASTGGHNVVLVKGSSVDELRHIYPNYFGDISDFVRLVEEETGMR